MARRGWAGEKSGLFEHPARCYPVVLDVGTIKFYRAIIVFRRLLVREYLQHASRSGGHLPSLASENLLLFIAPLPLSG